MRVQPSLRGRVTAAAPRAAVSREYVVKKKASVLSVPDRRSAYYVLATLSVILLVALVGSWIAFALSGSSSSGEALGGANVVTRSSDVRAPQSLVLSLQSMGRQLVSSVSRTSGDVSLSSLAIESARSRIHVSQADADRGTIRLTKPGYYVLDESIVFAPRPDNDHRPECVEADERNYCADAYTLGFFAAFSVEAPGIVLDLNGFSIEQSPLFALEQRFFSIIELASQPFRHGQGPAEFGDDLVAASGFALINGHLGRSSHHAIHGNDASRIYIHNVTMHGYEVAAIHLNGATDVVIDNCTLDGTRDDMPVIATYSQARFLMPFVERALGDHRVSDGVRAQLDADSRRLQRLMDEARSDIERSGSIDSGAHAEAHALFASDERIIDGNAYGIVLHAGGVAVNGFRVDEMGHEVRALVKDVRIYRTHAHVVDVATLARVDSGSTLKGPAGDVLRIASNAHNQRPASLFDGSDGEYRGNALSDAQLSLVEAVRELPASEHEHYGTLSLDEQLVEWRHGRTTLKREHDNHRWRYVRNGDSMHHVQKGVVGVRIGGVRSIMLDNVNISSVSNEGRSGHSTPLPGESRADAWYRDGDDGGHPAQGLQDGYMGADVRGVSIAGSQDIYFNDVRIEKVNSIRGNARGIDIFNYASRIFLGNTLVGGVMTAPTSDSVESPQLESPLRAPMAIGMHTSLDSTKIAVHRFHSHNVAAGTACQAMRLAAETYDDDVVTMQATRRQQAISSQDVNVYRE